MVGDSFKSWNEIKEHIVPYFKEEFCYLNVGCGNSSFSKELYEDGYKNIVNIDYSDNIITKMKKVHEDMPEMLWLTMNALDLKFDDNSFDVVLDKGTLDALLASQNDVWVIDNELGFTIHQYLSEILRVLKPNQPYIYITFGQPHFRTPLLTREQYNWTLETLTIGSSFHYFIYILTKNENNNDNNNNNNNEIDNYEICCVNYDSNYRIYSDDDYSLEDDENSDPFFCISDNLLESDSD
eukprot:TRINITY_DN1519_c0_g1_i1.p2 TRINITY_DN1519_c0_g1~~TRINITY_DN1519_c0_g1_i1.p2  ORF type:complete len:239 (+),score=54.09 TRINITY_DN1519_c0_g1_i1:682-1398(+)